MRIGIAIWLTIVGFCLLIGLAGAQGNTVNAVAVAPALNLSSTHYSTYFGAVAACAVCNKTVYNTINPYGIGPSVAAGNHIYYPYKVNSTIFVYNVSVAKNTSYICINLTSSLFNQRICQSGSYELPVAVINGHFGVDGPTAITVTATLSSSLVGSQTVPYSASINVGGINLLTWNNAANNTFSVTKTFTYSAGEALNITLDGAGNSNYTAEDPSVTVPANIIEYVPITFFNYQVNPVNALVPLAVGVANSVSGNVIGANIIPYSQYYTSTLNNAEFFGASGVLVNSWLEGNTLNEQQITSLSSSANILYWLNTNSIAPNGFLAAGSASVPATNTLYLGWTGNIITAANTLFNGITTGESPILSSTYGAYDNGNSVFTEYTNWGGTSLPSGWTLFDGTIGYYTVSNGITLYPDPGYEEIVYGTAYNPQLYAEQSYGYLTGAGPSSYTSTPDDWGDGSPSYFISGVSNSGPFALWAYDGSFGGGISLATTASYESVLSVWASSSAAFGSVNYNPPVTTSSGFGSSTGLNPMLQAGPSITSIYSQWSRVAALPPNTIEPGTAFGTPQAAGCQGSITGPSNAIVDAGQYETFNVIETGCSSTFTYNILVANAVTNVITRNQLDVGTSTTYNTFTFKVTSADTANSPEHANAIIKDSSPTTVNLPYTSNFITYNALTVTSLTSPATEIVFTPNALTFNVIISGGAPNYKFVWRVYNTITNQIINTTTYTGVSTSYNAFIFTVNNFVIGNTLAANVLVTDSATVPITVNSIPSNTYTILLTPYTISSITSVTNPEYETETQLMTYTLNVVVKSATTANFLLNVQSAGNTIFNQWSNQIVAAGTQSFPFSVPILLVPTNNIGFTYNAFLELPSISATLYAVNNQIQNVVYNYIPVETLSQANIIEGSPMTVNLVINDIQSLGLATYAGNVIIGNTGITETMISPYNYYAQVLPGFLNTNFGYALPAYNAPVTATANAIVQLTFNGNSVWRSQTQSFGTYLPLLVNCITGYPPALEWTFTDAVSGSQLTNSVLLTGFFKIVNNNYISNSITGTNAGFTALPTNNIYFNCIYPPWASFQTNSTGFYNGTEDSPTSESSYVLLHQATSNVLSTINLYIYNITNPLEYEIAVLNNPTQQYIASYIQEQIYRPATGTYVTINQYLTPNGGGYITYLNNTQQYQFLVYTPNGQKFLTSTTLRASTCSSTSCLEIIPVNLTNSTPVINWNGNFAHNCACNGVSCPASIPAAAISGNTMLIQCAFNSINGSSFSASLQITNSILLSSGAACSSALTAISGTVSCTVSNTNVNLYDWIFSAGPTGQQQVPIQSGSLGSVQNPFGVDGWFFAFVLILVMTFGGLALAGPTGAMLGALVGFIASGALQFIGFSLTIGGSLVLVAAIILFALRPKEG